MLSVAAPFWYADVNQTVGFMLRQYFAPLEGKVIVMHTQVYKSHDFIW